MLCPPSIYGRLSGIKGSFFSQLIFSSIACRLQLLHFPLPQHIFTAGNSLRMVHAFLLEEFVRLLLCPLLCFYTFRCFFCFFIDSIIFLLLYLIRHIDHSEPIEYSVDVSSHQMSLRAIGRSTTSPTFLIFPSASSTELYASSCFSNIYQSTVLLHIVHSGLLYFIGKW